MINKSKVQLVPHVRGLLSSAARVSHVLCLGLTFLAGALLSLVQPRRVKRAATSLLQWHLMRDRSPAVASHMILTGLGRPKAKLTASRNDCLGVVPNYGPLDHE